MWCCLSSSGALLYKAVAERTFPFPGHIYPTVFCDGYAELGIAVHDGNADLDLGNLSVEVPRHEELPQ